MSERLKSLLSRKFLLSVLGVVLVTFAVPADPQVKLDFIKWIIGFFLGANVIQAGALAKLNQ